MPKFFKNNAPVYFATGVILSLFSGAWGKLIHEKKLEAKTLVTLSLLRGQYNFNEPDKMIEWARSKGWGVRGHCLFWDVEEDSHYPDWVKPLTGQNMVDAVYGRLESAVNHYRVSLQLKIMNNEVETGIIGVVRYVK